MNTVSPTALPALAPVSSWRQWARRIYLAGGCLLVVAIMAQVFFAGAGVLVSPTYWVVHRGFAHIIEYLVIGLLLVGIATRLPWRTQGLGLLLYGLLFLQYIFLYLMPRMGVPLLRALHAVNALVLFGVALILIFRILRHMRG